MEQQPLQPPAYLSLSLSSLHPLQRLQRCVILLFSIFLHSVLRALFMTPHICCRLGTCNAFITPCYMSFCHAMHGFAVYRAGKFSLMLMLCCAGSSSGTN